MKGANPQRSVLPIPRPMTPPMKSSPTTVCTTVAPVSLRVWTCNSFSGRGRERQGGRGYRGLCVLPWLPVVSGVRTSTSPVMQRFLPRSRSNLAGMLHAHQRKMVEAEAHRGPSQARVAPAYRGPAAGAPIPVLAMGRGATGDQYLEEAERERKRRARGSAVAVGASGMIRAKTSLQPRRRGRATGNRPQCCRSREWLWCVCTPRRASSD